MKITKRMLVQHGACAGKVKLFAELFPHGVTLTKALCVKHAQMFDFDWAARNLLTKKQLAKYEKIQGPALSSNSLWTEYKTARAIAFYKTSKI